MRSRVQIPPAVQIITETIMSIKINKKTARLTFGQWLHLNRIDKTKCLGKCKPGECCEEEHTKQHEKEYRTEMYNNDVRLGIDEKE